VRQYVGLNLLIAQYFRTIADSREVVNRAGLVVARALVPAASALMRTLSPTVDTIVDPAGKLPAPH